MLTFLEHDDDSESAAWRLGAKRKRGAADGGSTGSGCADEAAGCPGKGKAEGAEPPRAMRTGGDGAAFALRGLHGVLKELERVERPIWNRPDKPSPMYAVSPPHPIEVDAVALAIREPRRYVGWQRARANDATATEVRVVVSIS